MIGPLAVLRLGLRILVFALLLLIGLGVGAAHALTYVMISDENLADQAMAIAEVDVLSVAAVTDAPFPMVEYEVLVERALKGTLGSTIKIRLPGGGPLDGGARMAGVPVFREGQRLLVFMAPLDRATYSLVHLSLGVFQRVRYHTGSLAVRDLREAVAIGAPDGEASDVLRDYDRFARWLIDRSQGKKPLPDYLVAPEPSALVDSVAEPFTLLTHSSDGRNGRWFEFDSGKTVQWFVNTTATTTGALSIEAFVRALGVWSEQAATSVNLAYAGTTTKVPGYLDGTNILSFGDPFDLMPGQFSCATGGVLAVGPPLPFVFEPGTIVKYNGVRYHKITEAEIFVNDGADCFLTGNPTGAEELFGHELGHTIGIGHACGNATLKCAKRLEDEALMRSFIHNDRRGAKVNGDDLKALSALYGTFDPPSELTATVVSSSVVTLKWKDNTKDEKKFRVELAIGATGKFVDLGTVPANSVGAQISSLPPGATIRLRVRAEKKSQWSNWSAIVTVQMPN